MHSTTLHLIKLSLKSCIDCRSNKSLGIENKINRHGFHNLEIVPRFPSCPFQPMKSHRDQLAYQPSKWLPPTIFTPGDPWHRFACNARQGDEFPGQRMEFRMMDRHNRYRPRLSYNMIRSSIDRIA